MLGTTKIILIVSGCLILMGGCSKKTTDISPPGGSLEVTKEGVGKGDVKITPKEGTVEHSVNKKADLASFGVPIYPGSSENDGGAVSNSAQNRNKNTNYQMATFTTTDPLDKVSSFYKDQLKDKNPKTMEMNMGNGKMIHFMLEENKVSTTIVISEEKGNTQIVITKETK